MDSKIKVSNITIEAVVTRANGSVENLGKIASLEEGTIENIKEEDKNGRCSKSCR